MRKILFTCLILSGTLGASATPPAVVEPVDTVMQVSGADLMVSQNDEGLTIDITEANGEKKVYTYPYSEDKTYAVERTYTNPALLKGKNFSVGFSGFSVGFNKALDAPAGLGLEMGKSMEFSLDQILNLQYHLPGHRDILAVGIGVDWKNYRTTGSERFLRTGEIVSVEEWEEGQRAIDSRVKTFSLHFPISYVHSFNSYAKVGLSVILNANLYGSLKGHFADAEGRKHETFQKCSGEINKFTVDFKATVQFCPFVALYCKYSPMNVFKKGRGPEFTPLSAGFTFFY